MAPHRASVIIPAHNAEHELPECLAALTHLADVHELIVVDDRSEDETAGVARRLGARLIASEGRGPAAARNSGAAVATGEILVFIDADCVPEPGCLTALLAAFDDPSVAGARGAYSSTQRGSVARFTQLELEEKQARMAASGRTAVIDTACAAYRGPVFRAYGGFDDRLPATSVEDVELSFRMIDRGEHLVFVPAARVRHRHPEHLLTYCRRKARFGFYRAGLYTRHPARLRADGYTPPLMPLQILLAWLVLGCAVFTPWLDLARWAGLVLAVGFLAVSLPLIRRAWRSDRGMVPWVPAFLLARSIAQGAGLLAGIVAFPFRAAERTGATAPSPVKGEG